MKPPDWAGLIARSFESGGKGRAFDGLCRMLRIYLPAALSPLCPDPDVVNAAIEKAISICRGIFAKPQIPGFPYETYLIAIAQNCLVDVIGRDRMDALLKELLGPAAPTGPWLEIRARVALALFGVMRLLEGCCLVYVLALCANALQGEEVQSIEALGDDCGGLDKSMCLDQLRGLLGHVFSTT